MKRRAFLSLLAGGAAAGVAPGLAGRAAAATGEFAGHPDAGGVLTDLTKCIGCRKCEEACSRVNDLPAPAPLDDTAVFEIRRRPEAEVYTVVNRYTVDGKAVFRKAQCMHCQEPACASACFVKAFTRNPDGSVTYDPSLCVGCRYCMVACPFNIPAYTYDRALSPVVTKCTMCRPRLQEGKIPGCVEACPTGALVYGKRRDLIALARKRIAEHPGRYVDHIYGEHEMGGTAWLTISGVNFAETGLREDLGTRAAGEYTAGVLGALPMVVGFWPIVLGGAYLMSRSRDESAAQEREAAVKAAVEEERRRGEAAAQKAEAAAQKALEKAVEAARKETEERLAAERAAQEQAAEAAQDAAPENASADNEGERHDR